MFPCTADVRKPVDNSMHQVLCIRFGKLFQGTRKDLERSRQLRMSRPLVVLGGTGV
jgi:hypothetical protein